MDQNKGSESMGYKTRKHQITNFIRRANLPLKTQAEKTRFRKAMRDACRVGACEERSRTLKILREAGVSVEIQARVVNVSVLQVLGFEKRK